MWRVGVGRAGDVQTAVTFDLPGCACSASTGEAVREMLTLAIAEYRRWLARHGEAIVEGDGGDGRIEIVEEIDAERAEGVEGEFVFKDDLRPLTADDVARAVRWMAYARDDLLRATDGLSDELLDWRPPASAMARIDAWKPMPLTIREILADIAGAERYYRTALCDGPGADDAADEEAPDLRVERKRSVGMLSSLEDADRGRVFAPQRAWQSGTERWTARKVVRRIIGHERFHTAEIEQRLSWIVLGAPEFGRKR